MTTENSTLEETLKRVRSCEHCLEHLPHGTRPVLQVSSNAKILIVGQAPGSKVHATGIPFDDPSGDRLRPRKECAELWRGELMALMTSIELTLVIGQYAIAWHLPEQKKETLTNTVRGWREHWPNKLPLPHPSPRNNIWLKKNDWFEGDVIPSLQQRIRSLLA